MECASVIGSINILFNQSEAIWPPLDSSEKPGITKARVYFTDFQTLLQKPHLLYIPWY